MLPQCIKRTILLTIFVFFYFYTVLAKKSLAERFGKAMS